MEIIYKSLKDIKPYKNNAKKHSAKQIEVLANSIKQFGFKSVVLIDRNNTVVAGHGRCLAAKKAGLKEIPCVYVDDLSEKQIKAFRLADNKTAESEWDYGLLDAEINDLLESEIDMSDFGFENKKAKEDEKYIYTNKTSIPQYKITGEKPEFSEMVNVEKYKELLKEIEGSNISEKEKKFLKLAATRHLVFNYANIAEYYANVASEEMQVLMEKSALVIIDFDDAIKYGYVDLMQEILALEEEDDEA